MLEGFFFFAIGHLWLMQPSHFHIGQLCGICQGFLVLIGQISVSLLLIGSLGQVLASLVLIGQIGQMPLLIGQLSRRPIGLLHLIGQILIIQGVSANHYQVCMVCTNCNLKTVPVIHKFIGTFLKSKIFHDSKKVQGNPQLLLSFKGTVT